METDSLIVPVSAKTFEIVRKKRIYFYPRGSIKKKLRYIFFYETAPIKAIRYYAEILEFVDNADSQINLMQKLAMFKDPTKEASAIKVSKPILLNRSVPSLGVSIQSRIYLKKSNIENCMCVSELFAKKKDTFSDALRYLSKHDQVIKRIIEDIGQCTLTPTHDYYSSLVKSIVYQQLSQKAARTIHTRLLAELKNCLSPENMLRLKDSQFRKAGISARKQEYLKDLSLKFKNGSINTEKIHTLSDEELIEHLTSIKGIGRWSAEMFLIFSLNRMDVLPLDDVGFKRAVMLNYNLSGTPSEQQLKDISKKWGEYKSIAVWYLWQSVNKK